MDIAKTAFGIVNAMAELSGVAAVRRRLMLSAAKQPSVAGHARVARKLARLVPYHEYGEERFFQADAAPDMVARCRREGFERLARIHRDRCGRTLEMSAEVERGLSDLQFTNAYRVPFQFREHLRRHLPVGVIVAASSGVLVQDLDGNMYYDLSGSYGVNAFGYDFYKGCIERGSARAAVLGPVLGPYHPEIAYVVSRLRAISGLDEVSFHMSGTEAVMQAVRLARYHTGRRRVVRFAGAYHGWWGDVQPGVGNPIPARDTLTLRDMDRRSLAVLRGRDDIACVLVNPIQAMHPNANPPADSSLIGRSEAAAFDREGYSRWLAELRAACNDRGIPLLFDEVFVGFRLARGGAQEYFGVRADLVTYGKTLGGGFPVGVVCGRKELMKRFRDDRPLDICLARGTFNSHPYVIAAMAEFLRCIDEPAFTAVYDSLEEQWKLRLARFNQRLATEGLPVRAGGMSTIWTIQYLLPSRYNWMLQFYLRSEGLALSWVGTGRLIFTLDLKAEDFEAITDRFVATCRAMARDGWWWTPPEASNRAIKREILLEMLRHGVHRSTRPAGSTGVG